MRNKLPMALYIDSCIHVSRVLRAWCVDSMAIVFIPTRVLKLELLPCLWLVEQQAKKMKSAKIFENIYYFTHDIYAAHSDFALFSLNCSPLLCKLNL